jgi:hypothetical protein
MRHRLTITGTPDATSDRAKQGKGPEATVLGWGERLIRRHRKGESPWRDDLSAAARSL